MRTAIHHAFSEQLVQMDEMFQQALTEATQPDRVLQVLTVEVDKQLKEAVAAEVKNFFSYGTEGRQVIAQAVWNRLKEDLKPEEKE